MKKLVGQLIVWHRLLGIGSCLFFAMWFVSGIVMMYWRMPELTEQQRLEHEQPLDLTRLLITPAQAVQSWQALDTPVRVILTMAGTRPVYRILGASGSWHGVYADDGSRFDAAMPVPATTAVDLAQAYAGDAATRLTWKRTLTDVDQWTVYPGSRPYLPFQLIAANDSAGTEYYVSGATGQIFLITTSHGRLMAWLGAIPHWLYLRAIRANTPLWRFVVITISGIGVAMCIAGIVAGLFRYSPSKRYRFRNQPPSSFPHTGIKHWHYYLGFVFGLVTFTWILSGLLSMNPGHWSPGPTPDDVEMLQFAGGPIQTELFQLAPNAALSLLSHCSTVRELEMKQLASRPFYLAKDASGHSTLIAASGAEKSCQSSVPLNELTAAALHMMHGSRIADTALISDYDNYYYDQHRQKPLPVLRLRFLDAKSTWLYLNPQTASIEARYTSRSRLERWLYNGLHTLDFPFLYRNRPLWDVTVIALSLGGTALSITGIVLAWRYLWRGKKQKQTGGQVARASRASPA